MSTSELNPKQARFVAEYLLTRNATQSAIAAGYSEKTAESQGWTLLRNPKINEAITAARIKMEIKTEITQERVLAELALLAFSDVGHYDIDPVTGKLEVTADAPKGARRAISSIKRKVTIDSRGDKTHEMEIRLWNKPDPLKLAGRHVGLFDEKAADTEPRETHIHINGVMPVPPEMAGDVPSAVGPETTTTGEMKR